MNKSALIDAAPDLLEACKKAVSAAEYVVQMVEAEGEPSHKSDWLGATMHCYAAMNFVAEARAAISKAEGKSC